MLKVRTFFLQHVILQLNFLHLWVSMLKVDVKSMHSKLEQHVILLLVAQLLGFDAKSQPHLGRRPIGLRPKCLSLSSTGPKGPCACTPA